MLQVFSAKRKRKLTAVSCCMQEQCKSARTSVRGNGHSSAQRDRQSDRTCAAEESAGNAPGALALSCSVPLQSGLKARPSAVWLAHALQLQSRAESANTIERARGLILHPSIALSVLVCVRAPLLCWLPRGAISLLFFWLPQSLRPLGLSTL